MPEKQPAAPSPARGPQIGAPPSLEFIAVERLSVDPVYQRATDGPKSRKIITGMVREWDWRLCHPLVVSRRPDGALLVLDGQHRHAGAVQRGDIAHLPCVVLPGLDHAAEAGTFVKLNTARQNLSQADIFTGLLASGDDLARQIAALIDETGWRVVRSSGTDKWRPGDLSCAPMLVRALKFHGPHPVRRALMCLRAAYPDSVVTAPANILLALLVLFGERSVHDLADTQVIRGLAAHPAGSWQGRAMQLRSQNRELSIVAAIARLICDAAQLADAASPAPCVKPSTVAHLHVGSTVTPMPASAPAPKAPPPSAPPQSAKPRPTPPAIAPVDRKFGTSGKGWYDQCEMLVSRETAAACGQKFCKMKASRVAA